MVNKKSQKRLQTVFFEVFLWIVKENKTLQTIKKNYKISRGSLGHKCATSNFWDSKGYTGDWCSKGLTKNHGLTGA